MRVASRTEKILRYGLSGVVSGSAAPFDGAVAPTHVASINASGVYIGDVAADSVKPNRRFTGTTAEKSKPARTLRVGSPRVPAVFPRLRSVSRISRDMLA